MVMGDSVSSSISTGSFVRSYSLLGAKKGSKGSKKSKDADGGVEDASETPKSFPQYKDIFGINENNYQEKLAFFLLDSKLDMSERYLIFAKVLRAYIWNEFEHSFKVKIKYEGEFGVKIYINFVVVDQKINMSASLKCISNYIDYLGSFYIIKISKANKVGIVFSLSYKEKI